MSGNKAVFLSSPSGVNVGDLLCSGDVVNSGAGTRISNTGCLAPNFCCLDYLKISIDTNILDQKILLRFLLKNLCLEKTNYEDFNGGAFYDRMRVYDEDVHVLCGHKCSEDEVDDNSIIELKGQALRRIEQRGVDYPSLFKFLVENGFTCLRIDLPIDDFSGSITPGELEYKVKRHYYQSRLVSKSVKVDYDKSCFASDDEITIDTRNKGWSLTIGGRSSRQLCIYDKRAERLFRGYEVSANNWMRYESRFYHDSAETVFLGFYEALQKGDVGSYVCGLLRGLIEFKSNKCKAKVEKRNQNKSHIWTKWNKLVGGQNPIFVKNQSAFEGTIVRRKKWLDKIVSNTLIKLLASDDMGMLPYLSQIMSNEKHLEVALSPKNMNEINNYLESSGMDHTTPDEIRSRIKAFRDLTLKLNGQTSDDNDDGDDNGGL